MTFERWKKLMKEFNLDINEITYRNIIEKYNANNLSYHNINHINYCLNKFDSIEIEFDFKKEIELAIWFHDVIYNPYGKENELKSAAMVKEFLNANKKDEKTISTIFNLIMTTQHSSSSEKLAEQIIMDIDISIFGESNDVYNNYSKSIRQEYSLIPQFIYSTKRKEILKSFLSRRKIFQTDYFFEKHEVQARINIKNEIEIL